MRFSTSRKSIASSWTTIVTMRIAAMHMMTAEEEVVVVIAAAEGEEEPCAMLLERPEPSRGEFFSAISRMHL